MLHGTSSTGTGLMKGAKNGIEIIGGRSEKRVSVLGRLVQRLPAFFIFLEADIFNQTSCLCRASGVAIRLSRIRNACEGDTPLNPRRAFADELPGNDESFGEIMKEQHRK